MFSSLLFSSFSFQFLIICSRANFEHKLHLLKAEASRVMLALNYEVIFYDEESTSSLSPTSPRNSEYNTAQDFEDTMELYERAIKGAKLNGFIQYEALGKSRALNVIEPFH